MNEFTPISDDIVSFNSETLILVDDQDQEIGHQDKLSCHSGQGILHRAFSLFIFNNAGELLLQQRSQQKQLWPLYWSNSCCSHPRRGETMGEAVYRRLKQELGICTKLQYLYKFKYQVPYLDVGAEHELCSVYVGQSDEFAQINQNEIADWKYISADRLEKEMHDYPERFTPWFKLEWECLRRDHHHVLKLLHVNI